MSFPFSFQIDSFLINIFKQYLFKSEFQFSPRCFKTTNSNTTLRLPASYLWILISVASHTAATHSQH